ncbi:MAG: response regulator [Calditrichaeota bacterium]|nr:MAG: response regulator [Calditrichota bacterium]
MVNILVVEDDLNTLSGLQELLNCEGFRAFGVASGARAMEILRSEPIDLLLCDFCLPDMDGIQVCETIKARQPEMPIVLVTAFCSPEVEQKASEIGIDKIFKKPIDLEELLGALNALSNRDSNQAPVRISGVGAK